MSRPTSPTQAPLVSVIIPAYNAEEFIGQTIDSVLAQTYKDVEILVINDGSQDLTAEIVEQYARKNSRVIYLEQSNMGVAAARNLGIQHSKGEFIAPIDADDIAYPQNIEQQVNCFLTSDSSVGVTYVWSVDIDRAGRLTGDFHASHIEGSVYATLLCHNFLGNASSTLIRRSCIEEVGLYDTQFKDETSQGCEDWKLYLDIAERYQFRVVPQFLLGYRKLSNSMSSNFSAMAKWHDLVLELTAQAHPEIPQFLYDLSRSNLYLYLARQSNYIHSDRVTFIWLMRAVKAERFTPFLRYGFYRLLLISVFRLLAQQLPSNWLTGHQPILQTSDEAIPVQESSASRKERTVFDIESQRLGIKIRILIWDVFHRVVSVISRVSKHRPQTLFLFFPYGKNCSQRDARN